MSYIRKEKEIAYVPKGHHLFHAPEMAEQVQQVLRKKSRAMSEFLRDAIRLYVEEAGSGPRRPHIGRGLARVGGGRPQKRDLPNEPAIPVISYNTGRGQIAAEGFQ